MIKLWKFGIIQVILQSESVHEKFFLSKLFKLKNFKIFERESVQEKFKFFRQAIEHWAFETFRVDA